MRGSSFLGHAQLSPPARNRYKFRVQRAEPSLRRVWITGAGGLIGSQLVALVPDVVPGSQAVPLLRSELDLTDRAAVTARFRHDAPSAIIHCAALSRSPACQADPALARRLNVEVTQHLAELAEELPFVFLSTDLVFDGSKGNYVEDDSVGSLSVYAETKVAAEAIVRTHPHHLVIRTSLNYGHSTSGDRGFNEELLNAWHAGRPTPLFTDEFRCPIAARETARAVLELLCAGATGVFHVAGAERLSRWEIGHRVAARHPTVQPQIIATSLKTFQGAPRPADVSLDCAKAEARLGRPLPKFTEWLAQEK